MAHDRIISSSHLPIGGLQLLRGTARQACLRICGIHAIAILSECLSSASNKKNCGYVGFGGRGRIGGRRGQNRTGQKHKDGRDSKTDRHAYPLFGCASLTGFHDPSNYPASLQMCRARFWLLSRSVARSVRKHVRTRDELSSQKISGLMLSLRTIRYWPQHFPAWREDIEAASPQHRPTRKCPR